LCAWDIPDDLSKPGFLAIAQRGIGDALTLLPSLRALRAARADVRIELVAPGLLALAENVRDTATIVDDRPLAALDDDERARWLRTRNFAWVWNTEGEQGPWHGAIQAAANSRWISTATQKHWRGRNVLRVRFAQLARLCPEVRTPGPVGLALTPAQETASRTFASSLSGAPTLVAIQPGAGDPNRVWPAEKFRALARALAQDPRVTVLVFLGDSDTPFDAPGYLPGQANLRCVREPLESAVSKLAACALFVGNDSGFYHLAFGLGLPVVGIYRSARSARMWGYRSPRARAVCPPELVPAPFRRHWDRWVSVERVLRAARKVMPSLRTM